MRPGLPVTVPVGVMTVLRGVGQIMLQHNAASGLSFVIGLAVASPWAAVGALAGSLIGAFAAFAMRIELSAIRAGLYGFNAALVGIASFFFFGPTPWGVASLVVGAALSSPVTYMLERLLPMPAYTAPFVLTTWALVAVGKAAGVPTVRYPHEPSSLGVFSGSLEGLSQVMFQADMMCGFLFLVGIAVNSRRLAMWAWIGALVGLGVALWHHDVIDEIAHGIFGYNAALAAVAIASRDRDLAWPLLAAILSVPLTEAFASLPVPTLTAPFVLASWLVIGGRALDARLADLSAPAA